MAVSFKGAHFPQEIISHVRPLVRGVSFKYASCGRTHARTWSPRGSRHVNRWVIKYSPPLEDAFHRRKRPVWVSWRMDETYIRVKGEWRYLYRAVDKYGETVDFLLTESRDQEAALRFLKKAIRRNGVPRRSRLTGVTPYHGSWL